MKTHGLNHNHNIIITLIGLSDEKYPRNIVHHIGYTLGL